LPGAISILEFFPNHFQIVGGLNANAHAPLANAHHGDSDLVANQNPLPYLP
jgi:hypothetical protein